jgi:hypothetical protein
VATFAAALYVPTFWVELLEQLSALTLPWNTLILPCIDRHDHPLLTMFALCTVHIYRLRIIDRDIECCHHGLIGTCGDEPAVNCIRDWHAGCFGGRLCYRVVSHGKLELNCITGIGSDLLRSEHKERSVC